MSVSARNPGQASKAIPVIAIDGPVGSGKGTISTQLAARLQWHLMDSGALYRLIAIAALDAGTDPDDQDALTAECRVAADAAACRSAAPLPAPCPLPAVRCATSADVRPRRLVARARSETAGLAIRAISRKMRCGFVN